MLRTETTAPLNSGAFRFNPFAAAFIADPYPTFDRMRREAPIYPYRTIGEDEWILTRFADVRSALTDRRFGADDLGRRVRHKVALMPDQRSGLELLASDLSRWLFSLDPPDHTRLRQVVSRDFTAGAVQRTRRALKEFVDVRLCRLMNGRPFDLMTEIARPMPAFAAAAMLGLDVERMTSLIDCSERLFSIFEQPISIDGYRAMIDAADRFRSFFDCEFDRRAGGTAGTDLIDRLLAACGTILTREEVVAFAAMLFSVGQETTENYIGNSVLALMQHPDQWELLCRDPGLIPRAALELARYDSAVQFVTRVPREDVELDGRRLRRGVRVHMALGAANRDPEAFTEPSRLDVMRSEPSNLPFGSGAHFCLGSALARLQLEVVLERLVQFDALRIAEPGIERRKTIVLRGLRRLPLLAAPANGSAR